MMTRILVAVASKHGATHDIAARIGDRLRSHGWEVVVTSPEEAQDLSAYDAAVVGSAVYAGHWRREARRFVEQHGEALREIPVWLFSSGPLGDEPDAADEPDELEELRYVTHARDHHVFSGRLDHDDLSMRERMVVRAVGAPYGDFRNWSDIDLWADAVATDLKRLAPTA